MIRIYVQLNKGPERQGVTKESVTQEFIVQTCQSMLRPYEVCSKRMTSASPLPKVNVRLPVGSSSMSNGANGMDSGNVT